jgi:hypothetical protein
MDERRPGFWSTLPGILTGAAALITAATGGYIAYTRPSSSSAQPQVSPGTTAAPVSREQAAEPADHASPAVVEQEPATSASAEVRATVVDPDGWTHLRAGPSINADIVGGVNVGEIFWTTPQDGNWWPARTEGRVKGYIHRSRVRLNP